MPITRTILKGVAINSFSTPLVKLIGLVSVFLILSHLKVSEYGTVELAISLTSLLGIFMVPGLSSLVLADASVEKSKGDLSRARAILFSSFTLHMTLGALAWSLTFFGADFFARFYGLSSDNVRLVSFLFLFSPFQSIYNTIFMVHLRFFEQSLMAIIGEVGKLCLLFILLFFFQMGVDGALYSIVFSQLLTVVLFAPKSVQLFHKLRDGTRASSVPWVNLLKGRGMWSILTSYMGNVGSAARLWIIRRFLGEEAVGLYALASGLMGHTIALASLSNVLTPLLPQYVHDRYKFIRLVTKGIEYQILAYIGFGIGAFFIFPPILGWIFPNYVEAFPLFKIMLLGLIPGAIVVVVTPAFFAMKMQKDLFISMSFKTLLTIVISYMAVMYIGLMGLAYESILVASFQAYERSRRLRKSLGNVNLFRRNFSSFDEDDRIIVKEISQALNRVFTFVAPFSKK